MNHKNRENSETPKFHRIQTEMHINKKTYQNNLDNTEGNEEIIRSGLHPQIKSRSCCYSNLKFKHQ